MKICVYAGKHKRCGLPLFVNKHKPINIKSKGSENEDDLQLLVCEFFEPKTFYISIPTAVASETAYTSTNQALNFSRLCFSSSRRKEDPETKNIFLYKVI